MVFTEGSSCWQGPRRSVEWSVACGPTEAVVSVEEPAKCVYAGLAQSPLACSPALVEALRYLRSLLNE